MSTATFASDVQTSPRSGLHYGLWTAQVLLALLFGMAGLMKATTPLAELSEMIPMAGEYPALYRFIGVSEILGAVGLILPSALRVLPKLTALAAAGLALIMVLAFGTHLFRGEPGLGVTALLFALSAFVAWGRFAGRPIRPRG